MGARSHLSLPEGLLNTVRAKRDIENDDDLFRITREVGSVPIPIPVKRTGFKSVDRLTGLLLGGAIGDALGMPVEGQDNEATLRALHTLGGIRDFLAPQAHVFRSLQKLKAGSWTDETQLNLAFTRSIIKCGRIDYDDIAGSYVSAFETLKLRGWDAKTKQACRRLSQGCNRKKSGTLRGNSNAVAARFAPIATWSALCGESREQLLRHAYNVGVMTHNDIRSVVGAYLIGLLIRDAVESNRRWEPRVVRYEELTEEARWAEHKLSALMETTDDPISQNLRELSDALDCEPAEIAEFSRGATEKACHSIPFIVAMLCSRPWELEEGIIAAVNAGGDTDTNGSIVGSILGLTYGARRFPRRFSDKVEESEMIRELGKEFAERSGLP